MTSIPKLPNPTSLMILCVLLVQAAWTQPAVAQETQDVVHLKDGSIIRGMIVEQVPGESILIQTIDGNRFRYSMEIIERMTKEPNAGAVTQQVSVQSTKSPGTAWVLSFLIPGAGQFYNGDGGEGAGFLIAHIVFSAWLAAEVDCADRSTCDDNAALAALSFIGNWVLAQVDAYQGAKAFNERLGSLGLEFAPRVRLRASSEVPSYGSRASLDLQLLRWSH